VEKSFSYWSRWHGRGCARPTQAPSAPSYDPAKEITIQGTVQEVLTAQHRGTAGIHLKVKSSDKVFDVRLGPAWFLDQKQFKFVLGDQVEVMGATISTNTGDALIAREVRKGGCCPGASRCQRLLRVVGLPGVATKLT
jgi:hypothetical protein